ncbi:hypothetical protein K4K60_004751 [Colletotrichum sp. SAR11_57]|nr:hypothetical protein K4K60_004751 [Colletotrichum sp. SAR11_57]
MSRARSVKVESDHDLPSFNEPQTQRPSGNIAFPVLGRLKDEKDPKVWEKHIDKAMPILERLEPVCYSMASSPKLNMEIKGAAENWMSQIATVRKRAVQTNKITIGVFGNTGDGKSSTINALLGEADLLPTNCMRACTACVTEISYNDDGDDEKPYKAEIDFVSPEEWMREVKIFLDEIAANNIPSDGIPSDGNEDSVSDEGEGDEESSDGEDSDEDGCDEMENEKDEVADGAEDCETARSVAKARAVYANMDNEFLLDSSVDELMGHPNVREVLGATQTFKAAKAEELRDMIERYIDSTDKDDDDAVAYWPLVKAVRIFTRAEALSNGVTIADLPGTHDADAARSSMAREYMRSCAGIWIVAPIDRAVDNKAARDLMSDNFKCQLNLDGSFSSVTFICSKTDHINLNDAVKNLKKRLGPEVMGRWKKSIKYRQDIKTLEKKLQDLQSKPNGLEVSAAGSDGEQPRKRIKLPGVEEQKELLEDMKNVQNDLVEQVRMVCIEKRNEISRDTLKNYFGRVMREARQQTAPRKNDPVQIDLDNKVSNNLPVFCTSSHAYQSMAGLTEDAMDDVLGFKDVKDTQIPQLQSHAQSLTEELRIAKYREGGIFHSTLKATLVRRGIWGDRNFNEKLLEPFSTAIMHKWADVFHEVIPSDLDEFLMQASRLILLTHGTIMGQIGEGEDEVTQIGAPLEAQVNIHQEGLKRIKAEVMVTINDAQKLASRKPLQAVAGVMNPGYEKCIDETGKGMVLRMRVVLMNHLMACKEDMFSDVVKTPDAVLDKAFGWAAETLTSRVNEIARTVRTDYMVALAKREESARREEATFIQKMVEVLEVTEPLLR